MFAVVREHVGDALWKRSIRRDHSRYGWRASPAYSSYHRRCQQAFAARGANIGGFKEQSERFAIDQFASAVTPNSTRLLLALKARLDAETAAGQPLERPNPFLGEGWRRYPEVEELWRTDLGDLVRAAFRSEFKIAGGWINFKAGGVATRKLWHSDSAPGTRLNIFVYLSDGWLENAPTSMLPWRQSQEIFMGERSWLRHRFPDILAEGLDKNRKKSALAEYYETSIEQRYPGEVATPSGPAGLMVLFNNNTLHAAGTPKPGHDRFCCTFFAYPALESPNFSRLAETGIPSKMAPPEPNAEF